MAPCDETYLKNRTELALESGQLIGSGKLMYGTGSTAAHEDEGKKEEN
jgi:hypothetical protein